MDVTYIPPCSFFFCEKCLTCVDRVVIGRDRLIGSSILQIIGKPLVPDPSHELPAVGISPELSIAVNSIVTVFHNHLSALEPHSCNITLVNQTPNQILSVQSSKVFTWDWANKPFNLNFVDGSIVLPDDVTAPVIIQAVSVLSEEGSLHLVHTHNSHV